MKNDGAAAVEKEQTNVRLPLDLLALLRVTAAALGKSHSEVVEEALRDYLPKHQVPETVEKMFGALEGSKS